MSIKLETPEQLTLLGNLLADRLQEWEQDAAKISFIRENPAEVAFVWSTHRDAIVQHEKKEYVEAIQTFAGAKQAIIENADLAQQSKLCCALIGDDSANLWLQSWMSHNRRADEVFQSMLKAAPDNLRLSHSDAFKKWKLLEIQDEVTHMGLSGFSCKPSTEYPRGACLSPGSGGTEEYAYISLTLEAVSKLQANPEKLHKIKADLGRKREDSSIAPARTDNGLPTGGSRSDTNELPAPKP